MIAVSFDWQNLGGMADAAHGGLFDVGRRIGKDPRQRLVEFAQRDRLHAIEGGDPQQHVVAQAIGEVLEDVPGVVELEMHQDGGDDLGMLVANQFGDAGGVHPFQAFDARRIGARHDAADQAGGAVVAQRLGQHGFDRLVIDRYGCALGGVLGEIVDHRFHPVARDLLERRHGMAELLDFLWPEVLEHFGGFILAQ
jgi:hypothetical protein